MESWIIWWKMCMFFVMGVTHIIRHGVYREGYEGVRLKYRIQKLIYRDQIQSNVIKRVYNLLIAQPKVHRESYELNKTAGTLDQL